MNVSSSGHLYSDVDLVDSNFTHTQYDPIIAYGRSMTATTLFAVAFDRRHRARGASATALHPGGILTERRRHLQPGELEASVARINAQLAAEDRPPFQFKTNQQGAATAVWAAFVAAVEEAGGRICEDCQVSQVIDGPISPVSPGVRPSIRSTPRRFGPGARNWLASASDQPVHSQSARVSVPTTCYAPVASR